MARNLYFIQSCSTCGRKLQVNVLDLGKSLICQHCGADIIAHNPDGQNFAPSELITHDPVAEMIEAADDFLLNQSMT